MLLLSLGDTLKSSGASVALAVKALGIPRQVAVCHEVAELEVDASIMIPDNLDCLGNMFHSVD